MKTYTLPSSSRPLVARWLSRGLRSLCVLAVLLQLPLATSALAANSPPTMAVLTDDTIFENPGGAGNLTKSLNGITRGPAIISENVQTLTITATSSNPGLIPNPIVNWGGANNVLITTGFLSYIPVPNASGTATITVTLQDNGGGTDTLVRTYTITVNPVNAAPTLNPIATPAPLTKSATPALQTVNLAGITAGPGESQVLTVTVTSSNTGLIPTPTVIYTSANAAGSLTYTPVANAYGSSVIKVTVTDDATAGGPAKSTSQSFTVVVNGLNNPPTLAPIQPLTIIEDGGPQVVSLSGISSGVGDPAQVLTITATSSNTGLIPHPTKSYVSPAATGSLAFTPVPNAFGTATITVTVTDDATAGGAAKSTVQTFTVTVNPVNDAPTLNPLLPVSVNKNSGVKVINLAGITRGAANETSETLVVTATSSDTGVIPNPSVSYATPNATGTINFTPVANAAGSATITVTVTDNGQSGSPLAPDPKSVVQTFLVTVVAVNSPPTLTAIPNPAAINENAVLQTINLAGIGMGAGDSGQVLTVTATSSNPGLIPTPTVIYSQPAATTGSLTYTPVANASGSAVITVTVTDDNTAGGPALSISRTFTVVVNSVNAQPTLTTITPITIDEDSGQQVVSLTGISMGTGDTGQTIYVSATSGNTALIFNPVVSYTSPNPTGTLTFSPNANASGTALITVVVSDNGGVLNGGINTLTKTFLVTVNPVNNAPTLSALTDVTISEDATVQTKALNGITRGPVDESSQTLTITATSDNTGLIPNPSVSYAGSATTGSLSFTPVANKSGTALITVTVTDNGQSGSPLAPDPKSVVQTFTVTVNAVNDQPTLDSIANPAALNENAGLQTVNLIGITAGGGESQVLTVTAISGNPGLIPNPTVSVLTDELNAVTSASLSYTPVADANGSALITVTVTDDDTIDGVPKSIIRTFTVTVNSVNTAPSFALAGSGGGENVLVNGGFETGDFTGWSTDNLGYGIWVVAEDGSGGPISPAAPLGGTPPPPVGFHAETFQDGPSAQILYQEFTVPSGSSQLSFKISWNNGAEGFNEDQHLRVFIGGSAEPLFVTDGSSDNVQDPTIMNFDLSAYAGQTISINFLVYAVNGPLYVTLDDVRVSGPSADQTVREDAGAQVVENFATDISAGPASESSQTLNFIVSNDNTALFSAQPAIDVATGTLTFTPAANANGTATVTVKLHDNGGTLNGGSDTSAPQTFVINVLSVNDAPTLSELSDLTVNEDSGIHTVTLANVTRGPGNENGQILTITATSDNTDVIPTPTITYFNPDTVGFLYFTPAANASGTAEITVTITDDGGTDNGGVNSVTRTFLVTVVAVNDAPTLDLIPNPATINKNACQQGIFLSGISTGAWDEEQWLTVTASSSNPSLIPDPTVSYDQDRSTSRGFLTYTPVTDASGTAIITVTVTDDDSIDGVAKSFTRTFLVTVSTTPAPPAPQVAPGTLLISGVELDGDVADFMTTLGYTVTSVDPGDFGNDSEFPDSSSFQAYLAGFQSIWLGDDSYFSYLPYRKYDLLNWVSNGGNLFGEISINPQSVSDYPLGETLSLDEFSHGGNDMVVSDLNNAVNYCLTNADLSNWGSSYHNWFYDTGVFTVVQTNTSGDPITLTIKYGRGNITYTGLDPSYHIHGDGGAESPEAEFAHNALSLPPNPPLVKE